MQIKDLPLKDISIRVDVQVSEAEKLFHEHEDLVGILLLPKSGETLEVKVIPRGVFFEVLSMNFGREIFLKREIGIMLSWFSKKPMEVDESDLVESVAHRVLSKLKIYKDYPILVSCKDKKRMLLHPNDLLLKYSTIYKKMSEDLKQSKELLETQVGLFQKFVPDPFLKYFKNSDYMEVVRMDEPIYSVLFIDIRGFTSFSERVSSKEAFNFLNSYFKVVEPHIYNHHGFIYKFLGDGIMALYPFNGKHGSNSAILSALSILEGLKVYNQGRIRAGYEEIRIGIGINTGPVAVGIAGSTKRLEAGAFGHTVNTAARCENLTKKFKHPILLTEKSYDFLRGGLRRKFKFLGKEEFRGLKTKIGVYGLESVEKQGKKFLELDWSAKLNHLQN